MRTPLGNAVFAVIKQRHGAENAVTAPEIVRRIPELRANERQVRRAIADESSLWPEIVCAIPGQGYFIPETYEELEAYDSWLGELLGNAAKKFGEFRELAHKHGFRLGKPLKKEAA